MGQTMSEMVTTSKGTTDNTTNRYVSADGTWQSLDWHLDRHTDDPIRTTVVDLLPESDDVVRYAVNFEASSSHLAIYTSDPYMMAAALRKAADMLDGTEAL